MVRNQGGLANISGSTLEKTVVGALLSRGFVLAKYRDWEKHKDRYGNELLLRNIPFETIYGHPGNTEFLLLSSRYNLKIRIECKWQQSPGSVDEKFPYLYLNCIEKMPEGDIVVIIDGGGAKEGAISWLREASVKKLYTTDSSKNKNIDVFDLKDFLIWVNKTFV